MDAYLRQAGGNRSHDEFYTDPTLINAFKNYISQVVPRYANSPAVFGWCV
jgi:Endo-beta-mannanase